MTEDTKAAVIKEFYAARLKGDLDRVRQLLARAVAWHDPYPPPHGGDLHGADRVMQDVFDRAAVLTGGTTRMQLDDVLGNDRHVVAFVSWTSTMDGKTMSGKELGVFHVEGGQIIEAWFYPKDQAASDAFFTRE